LLEISLLLNLTYTGLQKKQPLSHNVFLDWKLKVEIVQLTPGLEFLKNYTRK